MDLQQNVTIDNHRIPALLYEMRLAFAYGLVLDIKDCRKKGNSMEGETKTLVAISETAKRLFDMAFVMENAPLREPQPNLYEFVRVCHMLSLYGFLPSSAQSFEEKGYIGAIVYTPDTFTNAAESVMTLLARASAPTPGSYMHFEIAIRPAQSSGEASPTAQPQRQEQAGAGQAPPPASVTPIVYMFLTEGTLPPMFPKYTTAGPLASALAADMVIPVPGDDFERLTCVRICDINAVKNNTAFDLKLGRSVARGLMQPNLSDLAYYENERGMATIDTALFLKVCQEAHSVAAATSLHHIMYKIFTGTDLA